MLLLSSEDVHTRNNKSFPHRRSSSVAVYLAGHLAATLLKKNSGYFPRYVTNDGVILPHGDCKWIVIVVAFTEGGLYSRESAYSKISPLPSLGHVYC